MNNMQMKRPVDAQKSMNLFKISTITQSNDYAMQQLIDLFVGKG